MPKFMGEQEFDHPKAKVDVLIPDIKHSNKGNFKTSVLYDAV